MMARRSEGLGERPVKILSFLSEYQVKHGYSPSIREIGKHIGVTLPRWSIIIWTNSPKRALSNGAIVSHAASEW